MRLCAYRLLEHPVILQPRVTNHRELQALSGKGLTPSGSSPCAHDRADRGRRSHAFPMAVGSLVTDHFAVGGLASPVQLDDGRLGAVFKVRPAFLDSPSRQRRKPSSDATLPHSPEVKRMPSRRMRS